MNNVDLDIKQKIFNSNIKLHKEEAKYYDLIHTEIYNKIEQKRINKLLLKINNLINNNQKNALDIGSGTGNIIGKLLNMNYHVTAIDISIEMCSILKYKFKEYIRINKLHIINQKIENVNFQKGRFDLITCYSVLHHLPNYISVLQQLSYFLKEGGIIYLDHERSPYYWKNINKNKFGLKHLYHKSNKIIKKLNNIYFKIIGINIPSFNYTYSDYWNKLEHHLKHDIINKIFETENFQLFKREDYHLHTTNLINPIYYFYKHYCHPDTSLWIAKK